LNIVSTVRWLWFVSLSLVLFAGCQPRDPLDWKISARNHADFDDWANKNMILLPPELAKELKTSIEQIAGNTPRAAVADAEKAYYDNTDPVCRQLHHHTVRDVIISGYLVSNTVLLHRVNRELVNISKFTAMLDEAGADPAKYHGLERVIKYHQLLVDRSNSQIAANKKRIEELEAKNTSGSP